MLAVNRGAIKSALDDWNRSTAKSMDRLLARTTVPALPKKHALALLGVRRCGKTHLGLEVAKRSGLRTLYFNFEDPLFYAEADVSALDQLVSVYSEFEGSEPELIVFDEIQNVEGWERWVRKAVDTERHRLIVTGSSARLLSAELATAIAGRARRHEVWPLSLSEVLAFQGVDLHSLTPNERVGAARRYLEWGGMPEVVLTSDHIERTALLRHYVDDIVLRDVISRHSIREKRRLDQLIAYITTNASCLFSYRRIKGVFGIDVDTAQDYFSYLNDAFFAFAVSRFHPNLNVSARDPQKLYVIDTGMRNAMSRSHSEDIGRLAENAVYIELRRRGCDVTYWQSPEHGVDFVVRDGPEPVAAIQVSWDSLGPGPTRDRELAAMFAALEALGLPAGTVLTLDREERVTQNQRTVTLMPVWRFLIGDGDVGAR